MDLSAEYCVYFADNNCENHKKTGHDRNYTRYPSVNTEFMTFCYNIIYHKNIIYQHHFLATQYYVAKQLQRSKYPESLYIVHVVKTEALCIKSSTRDLICAILGVKGESSGLIQ